MLIIEFTNTYGDVGRVEILRISTPESPCEPAHEILVLNLSHCLATKAQKSLSKCAELLVPLALSYSLMYM